MDYCHPSREKAYRAACANNLKQLSQVLDLYAAENREQFPPVADVRNNFIFEGNAFYPEYLTDTAILACPSDPQYDPKTNFSLRSNEHHPGSKVGDVHPDCITGMSYVYLGWLVTSDEEAEAFFEAYDKLSPEDYDKGIVVPEGRGNGGGNVIYRLQQNVERYINDPSVDASLIPVIWDRSSNEITNFSHVPAGGNVLYLDGHVEFVRFREKFPMTETFAHLLDERPRESIQDCEGWEVHERLTVRS